MKHDQHPHDQRPSDQRPVQAAPAEPALHPHDHRRLGRELALFATDPLLPVGMPIWLPDGAAIRAELERYIVEAERVAGYQAVYSPPLGNKVMYEISGHWEHYADAMFAPIEDGAAQLVLRPMNCPHHVVAYRARPRSWRELPLRISELGAMFRNEASGSLSGLSRVRAMTLNDAHHFVDEASIEAEVALCIAMIEDAYAALGLSGHQYRLSLRGPSAKYVADDALWERAEAALAGALDRLGVDYVRAPGEAAFYGPKIDVQMPGRDVGDGPRVESFSSVQLDFHLPAQFDLSYAGPDGPRRPVMIHRTVLSSMERCLSFLLEQHEGNLPVWLGPVQVAVLPVSADRPVQVAFAAEVVAAARRRGLRAELVGADESLGSRVRKVRSRRVPYRVVVGDREAASGQVALALRDGRQVGQVSLDVFLDQVSAIASGRSAALWT